MTIPLYHAELHVFIGGTRSEITDNYKRIFPAHRMPTPSPDTCDGFYSNSNDSHVGDMAHALWLPTPHKTSSYYADIAHESLHATVGILTEKGVKFCDESEEAYAYLLGFIVTNIIGYMDGKKLWKRKAA